MKPVRMQLRRSKGFNLQAASVALNGLECVVVARPSRWGNPFVIGKDGTREECVQKYREMLLPYSHRPPNNTSEHFYISEANLTDIASLRGKNLACWCPQNEPCHADVLLELANLPEL